MSRETAGRVLVVDDELLIRWALTEALAEQGFAVSGAADGLSAVAAITGAAVPPDVVLLDYRLPDSNDLNLLSTILTLVPAGRVILMTAFGTAEAVQGALERGAFRVVSKPFEIADVVALVRHART